jgi:hypothetical protein
MKPRSLRHSSFRRILLFEENQKASISGATEALAFDRDGTALKVSL